MQPVKEDIEYLEELYKSLEKVHLLSERVKIILTGDFNFPDIDWNLTAPLQPNSLSDYFCDTIMNYFCLTQSIDTPTRGDAILDLVISNCPENLMDIDVCDSLGTSDHNIVNFNLAGNLSRPYQAPKLVYDYKNANWESFRNDLSSAPWDSILNENNVDDMWNGWKGLFMQAV